MTMTPACLLLLALLGPASCARILALLPLGARSHHVFFQPILRTLALRGHNITVYSPFPQQEPVPNLNDVFVQSQFLDVKQLDKAFWRFVVSSQLAVERAIWDTCYQTSEEIFKQAPIKQLMDSDEHIDLVITQALVGQECMLAFGHKFNAPTIALQPKVACTTDNRVAGNSLALSYIPDIGLPYSNTMTFWERFVNTYSKLNVLYYHYFHQIPKQEALLHKYFKGSIPPLIDLVHNISLVFTLGHPTALYAQPSTPNIIPLAGIHIDKDRKPLPQDIKKFMDEAKHGVIYFSLGTYVPDHMMDKEYFQNYINVFKTLPQHILWKTRAETIDNLPPNVKIGKWMPQQDILAHPKCILFITHGGFLSQIEAVYFGVPVVGVPYFADQPMNVQLYERYQLGVQLHHTALNADNIHRAITTVLLDPKYRENMKRQSRIFRDQPMSPSDKVVYWTEYILRNGVAHLRPHAAQLPLYQLALLDVLSVLLSVIILALSTLYIVVKIVWYYIVNKPKTKSKIS